MSVCDLADGKILHCFLLFQDWMYATTGCMELTVYTDCCHAPNEKDLPAIWKSHEPALLALIKQVSDDLVMCHWPG